MSDIRQWLEEPGVDQYVDAFEQEPDSEALHELMSTRPKIAGAGPHQRRASLESSACW